MRNQPQWSKMYKHLQLMECEELLEFLPDTYLYDESILFNMLDNLKTVIVKPDNGFGGEGVIKISDAGNGNYRVHSEEVSTILSGKTGLVKLLRKSLKKRRIYLIQHYIPLATVNGNLLDFRYIVQRRLGERDWVITGKHGKVAHRDYIVTNLLKGADRLLLRESLERSSVKELDIDRIIEDLDSLALAATECLTRAFPSKTLWGHDLAVDENGRVWLIEANSHPLTGAFGKLKDKSMNEKIESYRSYNRLKYEKRLKG